MFNRAPVIPLASKSPLLCEKEFDAVPQWNLPTVKKTGG
jgi:hypothetical protein